VTIVALEKLRVAMTCDGPLSAGHNQDGKLQHATCHSVRWTVVYAYMIWQCSKTGKQSA